MGTAAIDNETVLESVQQTYGKTLVELGRENPRIVVVDADLMKAAGSHLFAEAFPERHFQVGIAEQNLLGVAAGLASTGKIPFANSFSNFLSQRACDQAVHSVAYNRLNVKICGSYAGITQEKNGGTHMGIEELAIYRCMPHMVVVNPCDCVELSSAMRTIAAYDGPVYLRMPRGPLPRILPDDYHFEIGKAMVLHEGNDASLITSGITTWQGVQACNVLESRGLRVRHIHVPTIKPLDEDAILSAARETTFLVTAEDHSKLGGLGGAVAELVSAEHPTRVVRLGIDDRFGETATLDWLLDKFGISAARIAAAIIVQLSCMPIREGYQ